MKRSAAETALTAEHKEPGNEQEHGEQKEGSEENKRHGEERAEEVAPIAGRLFRRRHWVIEEPCAGRWSQRSSTVSAEPIRRIHGLSAVPAFSHVEKIRRHE